MVESMRADPLHQQERHDRSKIQQAAYGAFNQSVSIAQVHQSLQPNQKEQAQRANNIPIGI